MRLISMNCMNMTVAFALGLAAFSLPVRAEIPAQGFGEMATTAFEADDSPTIVGGQDAKIEEFPWQVALTDGTSQFCGGSIIDARWILTAAHCATPTLTHIRAGVTNKTDSVTGQDIPVLRQILHPAYEVKNPNDSDIMLLELASPLNLSGPKAKAIPIMTAQAAASGIQNPGVNALISGWGALSSGGTDPDVLQKAIVPIVANEEAAVSYAANPDYGPGYITAKMIAAGYLGVGNIDACQGDSGGPMVVSDNANAFGYRLAGVTSFGEGCASPDYMGIYTRVSKFEIWINNKMSSPPPYNDVLTTSWAYDYINAIRDVGITGGCGNGNYCPQDLVTREQMAAFLVRAVEGEPAANYCGGSSYYSDVAPDAWSCRYIKRLAELNITGGCGGGNYCPEGLVTREQMAAFIVRAVAGEPALDYCGGVAPFQDVAPSAFFCRYIRRLVELGVTQGCGNSNYCPGNEVNREQMAAFLARSFLKME